MAAMTELQRRLEEQRKKGRGINPGDKPDPVTPAVRDVKTRISEAVKSAGKTAKRVLVPQDRPATAAEDETSKLQGQRAYYEGKIERMYRGPLRKPTAKR